MMVLACSSFVAVTVNFPIQQKSNTKLLCGSIDFILFNDQGFVFIRQAPDSQSHLEG